MTPSCETYESVRPLIFSLCHHFHQRFGGDWQEICGQAQLHFARACHSHNPGKSRLTTWVQTKVWYGLAEDRRNELRKLGNHKQVPYQLEALPARPMNRLGEILEELSTDARAVVELTLGDALDSLARERGFLDQPKPISLRNRLVELLLEAGWSASRILKTFHEIREVLQ